MHPCANPRSLADHLEVRLAPHCEVFSSWAHRDVFRDPAPHCTSPPDPLCVRTIDLAGHSSGSSRDEIRTRWLDVLKSLFDHSCGLSLDPVLSTDTKPHDSF